MKKQSMKFNGHDCFAYYKDGQRVRTINTYIWGCRIGSYPKGIPVELYMEPWVEEMDSLVTADLPDGKTVGYPLIPRHFTNMTEEMAEEKTKELMLQNIPDLSNFCVYRIDKVEL